MYISAGSQDQKDPADASPLHCRSFLFFPALVLFKRCLWGPGVC